MTCSQSLFRALLHLAQLALYPKLASGGLSQGLSLAGVHTDAATQHGLFDLLSDHRSNLAQVLTDGLNLLRRAHQELEVALQLSGFGTLGLSGIAGPHEVGDQNLGLLLPVPVDAAVTLLQAIRVPRDLIVNRVLSANAR